MHECACDILASTVSSPVRTKQGEGRRRRNVPKESVVCDVDVRADAELPTTTESAETYDHIATQLASHLGRRCVLIGSGIFFRALDADVVILNPDVPCLADAYRDVEADLHNVPGWETTAPLAGDASGDHVTTIRGRVGCASTGDAKERSTRRMRNASQRSPSPVSSRVRMQRKHASLRVAAAMGERAGCRGHVLCNLSGGGLHGDRDRAKRRYPGGHASRLCYSASRRRAGAGTSVGGHGRRVSPPEVTQRAPT